VIFLFFCAKKIPKNFSIRKSPENKVFLVNPGKEKKIVLYNRLQFQDKMSKKFVFEIFIEKNRKVS
jgi:hypothetical protein